eukprot:3722984-Amphidinium_carterae.1
MGKIKQATCRLVVLVLSIAAPFYWAIQRDQYLVGSQSCAFSVCIDVCRILNSFLPITNCQNAAQPVTKDLVRSCLDVSLALPVEDSVATVPTGECVSTVCAA